MDINYQLQLCQDKEAKILVNQIDTQCKLVLLGMYKNSNWRLRLGTWEWQLSWGVHTVNVERWRSGWTARSVDNWTYTVQWTHTHINTNTLT